jgi:hypothetical protein
LVYVTCEFGCSLRDSLKASSASSYSPSRKATVPLYDHYRKMGEEATTTAGE